MGDRATAAERLQRLLWILPAAGGEEGASLDWLAERLGVERAVVLRDLAAMGERAYYHPPGGADDIQISVEAGRVRTWTGGKFDRPVRLGPRETLALTLGLRSLAAEAAGERRERILALARRLESEVGVPLPDSGDEAGSEALDVGESDAAGIVERLRDASAGRRCCRIEYLKVDAEAPEPRTVEPWALARSGGRWYAVGWCRSREGVRVFRADRMLAVEPLDESFEVPEGFDPWDYVEDGRVYRADAEAEAEVRVLYDARIAPWIEEQGTVDRLVDGSVAVTYRVADGGWAVRHALRHGDAAEVVDPAGPRRATREAARRVAERHGG